MDITLIAAEDITHNFFDIVTPETSDLDPGWYRPAWLDDDLVYPVESPCFSRIFR